MSSAVAKRTASGIQARVHPTMIPQQAVLAGVSGSMNAIEVHGDLSGPTLYYGAGAGALPTASAVVADLMELARARRLGASGRVPPYGTPEPGDAEKLALGKTLIEHKAALRWINHTYDHVYLGCQRRAGAARRRHDPMADRLHQRARPLLPGDVQGPVARAREAELSTAEKMAPSSAT